MVPHFRKEWDEIKNSYNTLTSCPYDSVHKTINSINCFFREEENFVKKKNKLNKFPLTSVLKSFSRGFVEKNIVYFILYFGLQKI